MELSDLRRLLPDRVARRIAVADNGCWHYTGSLNGSGYAYARIGEGPRRLHRVVYSLVYNREPVGDIDHTCHNGSGCRGGRSCLHRRCVRPDHLEDSSHGDNVRRGEAPSALNARKTHCPRGHPYVGDNLVRWRNKRYCRTCRHNRSTGKEVRLPRRGAPDPARRDVLRR